MIRPLVIVAGLLVSAPAFAQLYCSAPSEPHCIGMLGMLRDEVTFQMCRREVEDYRHRVREYISCLREEQADAIVRLNRTVERFNCHARGQSFCP